VRRQNKQAAIAKASHLVIPQRLFHDANLTVVTLERDLQHNVDALVSDPPFNAGEAQRFSRILDTDIESQILDLASRDKRAAIGFRLKSGHIY
jgi:hypothetical protein